jgi:protein SCO1/2
MRKFLIVVTLLLLAATSAMVWVTGGTSITPVSTEQGEALIGGSFTLTNHNGSVVNDTTFHNKLALVFFGFTSCPEICPTTAATMTRVMSLLGDKGDQITPIFITVDAERDTPDAMRSFLTSFDKRFVGLTGTESQLKHVASVFKAYYAKSTNDASGGFDHSAFIYLMDRQGKYIRHFSNTTPDAEIADAIKTYLN